LRLTDTHCHLDHIERPVDEVVAEAAAAGVERVIDVGMGLEGSLAAAERAAARPGVFAAVGLHPNDLTDFASDPDGSIDRLRELGALPGVVAIGETGLDYFRERSAPDLQEAAFRAHIALAKDIDRTLVIHCRDAHKDVLRVIDDAGPPDRVVMHCFSGDVAFARACNERRFFCSFAGNLTYKRNDELRTAAKEVDDDLLLVETDAPFLAPMPFRGKPNAPALVVHTAKVLADVRGLSTDVLADMLWNATDLAFTIA